MPQITFGDTLFDPLLSDMSVGWLQDESKSAVPAVFPFNPVTEKSGRYVEFDKEFFRRELMRRRGLGKESESADFEVSRDTYTTEEWSLKVPLDEQILNSSPSVFGLRERATEFLNQQLLLKLNNEFVSNYFGTGIWTSGVNEAGTSTADLDGSGADFTQWDSDNGSPYDLIDANLDEVEKVTGFRPNVGLMGAKVFRELKNHTETFNRISIGQTPDSPMRITPQLIAQAMGLDRLVVSRLSQETGAEGATSAPEWVFTEDALLLTHAAPRPSLMTPSGGYVFVWTGAFGGQANDLGGVIERRVRDAKHSEEVEIRVEFDMKLISGELGVFFQNAVA